VPTLERPDTTIHYELDGSGPPVLLIQGVGVIGAGWTPQVEALRDRFTLCAFDNRGIGRSAALTQPTSIGAMADDALALLDALGWARAHVVGHSMGGLIAEQLALDAPTRVHSLGLLCTPASGRAGARPGGRVIWIAVRGRVGTRAMRRRAFLELVMPRSARLGTDADLAALAERLVPLFGRDLADNPPILLQQLRAMGRHDITGRLSALASIPTLVVSADEDPIAPPSAGRATAQRIGSARHVELPDSGHGVTLHRPDVINSLLAEHWLAAGCR
jgi:pimeloyl-ACP methyl ester carboxylesterase